MSSNPPWEHDAYKLDVLADELGVNFRDRYIKNRFQQADSVELQGKNVIVTYSDYLPGNMTAGTNFEWCSVAAIQEADDGGIEVTLEVDV